MKSLLTTFAVTVALILTANAKGVPAADYELAARENPACALVRPGEPVGPIGPVDLYIYDLPQQVDGRPEAVCILAGAKDAHGERTMIALMVRVFPDAKAARAQFEIDKRPTVRNGKVTMRAVSLPDLGYDAYYQLDAGRPEDGREYTAIYVRQGRFHIAVWDIYQVFDGPAELQLARQVVSESEARIGDR